MRVSASAAPSNVCRSIARKRCSRRTCGVPRAWCRRSRRACKARNRGAIVNVTSLAGRAVGPLNGFYAASKWALEALSEAMYIELAHWGIKVIAIEPGYIATPMLEKDEGYGTDVPPYDELGRIWEGASTKLSGGDPPGPELVAAAIADALEEEEPVLRRPVGADAEMVVAARESMSFEQFIASMRELLGLDW